MAQLPFLAVGRVADAMTLASFCPDTIEQAQQRDTEDVFKKLLTAAGKKLRHGEKTRLQWNDGSVCCLMDNNKVLLYCVVTSDLQYPERLAYGMLVDLMKIVDKAQRENHVTILEIQENKLSTFIRSDMQNLMEKYEDSKQWQTLMDSLNQVSAAQAPANDDKDLYAGVGNGSPAAVARPQGGSSNAIYGLCGIVILVVVVVFVMMRNGDGDDPTTTPPAASSHELWI